MKLQEMTGLAVFDVEDGKQVGDVQDVLLNEQWKIVGILLEGKQLLSSSVKVVFWDDIMAYGEDAVMIRNRQAITKWDAENIQLSFLSGSGKLKGIPVMTGDGTVLGHVSDVYFDQKMGNTITGIEISDGLISDLMEGRKVLPYIAGMTKGENAIMVPPGGDELLEAP